MNHVQGIQISPHEDSIAPQKLSREYSLDCFQDEYDPYYERVKALDTLVKADGLRPTQEPDPGDPIGTSSILTYLSSHSQVIVYGRSKELEFGVNF